MAISRVGADSTAGTSLTAMAGVAIGDVEVVYAFRNGSTTNPTVPGGVGWNTTPLAPRDGTTCSESIAWRIVSNTSAGTGTWTNATHLARAVYRGAHASSPIGAVNDFSDVSNAVLWDHVDFTVTNNTSWLLYFGSHRTATNLNSTLPTGLTSQSAVGSGPQTIAADSNGTTTTWSNTSTVTVNANSGYITTGMEIVAATSVTHATSGALTGPGATIAGTAAHKKIHGTSGVLTGPGSTIAGTAQHKAKHATSGVLTGPGSTVAGTARRFRAHATSGALTGPGSTIAGTAQHKAKHTTSGALVGPGATIAGSAARASAGPVTHATSGALIGAGSLLAGIAQLTSANVWRPETQPSTNWNEASDPDTVWTAQTPPSTTWTEN